jgi:hypothetical protein
MRHELRDAMAPPLRAVSSAFQTMKINDADVRKAAFTHYSTGLSHQRRRLNSLFGESGTPSKEDIMASLLIALLLLEFELLAPTSLNSWSQHAAGSLQLLKMLGPEACQGSPLFEIFSHLRFIVVSLLSRQAT